jgi:hypothetical protein
MLKGEMIGKGLLRLNSLSEMKKRHLMQKVLLLANEMIGIGLLRLNSK